MLCAVVRGWKLRARRRGKFCNFRFKPLLPAHEAQGIERSDAAKETQKDRLYCVGREENICAPLSWRVLADKNNNKKNKQIHL